MNAQGPHRDVEFRVPVAHWSAWPPLAAQGSEPAAQPDVHFVEPLLRRRLSRLATMTLHVAHACTQGVPRLRLVFASRHGELKRAMVMLRELARSAPLSPTAFSLSVHNTAAGILSIVRQDRSPTTAIAAGDETLGFGLLEAFCEFAADPALPVLMVYGDEPLPDEYRGFAERPERPHAVAILLAGGAGRDITLTMTAGGAAPSPESQSFAFLQCLSEGIPGTWHGSQHTWTWH